MVTKAFIRANIPFVIHRNTLKENHEWNTIDMRGDFLLKHINDTFEHNVNAFAKPCNKELLVPIKAENQTPSRTCRIRISEAQIYCFETGIGICTLHIPFGGGTDAEDIADECSLLYRSVEDSDCCVLDSDSATHLSCIAESLLLTLFQDTACYTLFGTVGENDRKRINMFSCVQFGHDPAAKPQTYHQYSYQLANAYDNRDKHFNVSEKDLYFQHSYICWSFSTRGCAAISHLTGVKENDDFLNNRWFISAQTNYFYLYIMALHQKFATYNYLSIIANDKEMERLEVNQKALLDFNSKYIFSIVSDEQFIQDVHLRFKVATNVDDAYVELLDQLKKMFDYTQFKAAESAEKKNQRLNLISLLISVVCSVSVILDTISLFVSSNAAFGFGNGRNALFTGVLSLEVLLFVAGILAVFLINKKKNK